MRRLEIAATVAAVTLAIGAVLLTPMMAQHVARKRLERDALMCTQTTSDFSDSGIVRCYTSRGLPVPGDL